MLISRYRAWCIWLETVLVHVQYIGLFHHSELPQRVTHLTVIQQIGLRSPLGGGNWDVFWGPRLRKRPFFIIPGPTEPRNDASGTKRAQRREWNERGPSSCQPCGSLRGPGLHRTPFLLQPFPFARAWTWYQWFLLHSDRGPGAMPGIQPEFPQARV